MTYYEFLSKIITNIRLHTKPVGFEREGQYLMNELCRFRPDLYFQISNSDENPNSPLDCFELNSKIPQTLKYLQENW